MPADIQYVDANVLLAYVLEEDDRAPVVEQLLREAAEGNRRLITSTVSIVEVAFGAEKAKGGALDPGTLLTIDNLWSGGLPVGLAEASTRIMYEARDLARAARAQNRKLTPNDAIHLATAVRVEGGRPLHIREERDTVVKTRWNRSRRAHRRADAASLRAR